MIDRAFARPVLLVVLLLLMATPALAQVSVQAPAAGAGSSAAVQSGQEEEEEEKDSGDWDLIVNPYFWLPNLNVEANVEGVDFSGTATLDELLKDLNFGFMGSVEVRYKNRWFAGMDGVLALLYAKSESDPAIVPLGPTRVTAGPLVLTIPAIPAQVGTIKSRVDVTQLIALGYLGYRIYSGPVPDWLGGAGPADEKQLDFDAYVGGRLWYNEVTINANGPPIFFPSVTGSVSFVGRPNLDLGHITIPADATGPINVHVDETIWWVDPVIGGRLRMDLSDRYFVKILGDVGGFNWGDASKFTWQGWAMLGRRIGENWTVEGGYRGLGIIRDAAGNEADIIYQGPVFGATYRF